MIQRLRQRFEQWLFGFGRDEQLPVVLTRHRIFILPTGAGLLYAVVLVTMLIGAINYSLSLGHALVFLLAGLGLVAMVHTFRNLLGLSVRPGRAEPVFAGETAHFTLHIENPWPEARRALELAIGKNPLVTLELVPPGEQAAVAIPCAAAQRGRLDPGRVTLASRYPLGLFRAWSYPHPPLSCLVYPKPLTAPMPPFSSAYEASDRRGRSGQDDFSGLRERRPNDPPRHIAWKTAARDSDRPLLIKQFDGGAAEELWLDWNQTPARDVETRLSLLAGWVLAAEHEQVRYGLRLPNRVIAPDCGPLHRDACLEALALHV